MDSPGVIKYNCLRTIAIFRSIILKHYNKRISKRLLFIPIFINQTPRSDFYIKNKSVLLPLFLQYRRKINLYSLVRILYKHQSIISWVDFRVYRCDKRRTIFFVELVCINKKSSHLNYHLYWSQDLFKV